MKPIAAFLALFCLWIVGRWLLHLSAGTMLLSAGVLVVLAMLRELWWSEKAYRSSERQRLEDLDREREFGHARRRERGD